MHQLIYVSEARPGLSSADVFTIIEQSARNNPSADITGFLVYRRGCFLQLVDGPLMSLEDLLTKLGQDPRHTGLRVLSRVPIAKRSFPRWRMKRLGEGTMAATELADALQGEAAGYALPAAVTKFLNESLAA